MSTTSTQIITKLRVVIAHTFTSVASFDITISIARLLLTVNENNID